VVLPCHYNYVLSILPSKFRRNILRILLTYKQRTEKNLNRVWIQNFDLRKMGERTSEENRGKFRNISHDMIC
jgi:hypothetical protein